MLVITLTPILWSRRCSNSGDGNACDSLLMPAHQITLAFVESLGRRSFQHPTSYFRHRKVWKPEHGMDTQTRQRMNEALAFMVNHASYQRDIAVLLLLYHTGARLHEVLGMAVGSYRKTHDPHKAYLVNKGSQGKREEKTHFLS